MQINGLYKIMSKACYSAYLRNLQASMKANPKVFWNYVRCQKKENGLPSVMKLNDIEGSNELEHCQLFATKFSGVFSNEHLETEQIIAAASNVPLSGLSLNAVNVSNAMIIEAASRLKSSSSCGPDGIPSILVKKSIENLVTPLQHIFQLSLNTGTFPSLWKNAYMFPVHKKGDKSNVDNYRGISALCAVSKLFELVILEPVFFECKHFISNDQHGFMPKRSTTTNLLCFTTYVIDGMAHGLQTDAIYTDLSSAFDKINHDIAIAKLSRLGFNGAVLNWFRSYLTGRLLNVKIGDHLSDSFAASSGVPQGSHLGPLLFILYLNDVNKLLEGPRLSYADDFKIFLKIAKPNDASFLQKQLLIFANWCDLNRMVLNAKKCAVVSFSRSQNPVFYDYSLSGERLSRESSMKDLGVILDSKMTFRQHVSYITEKASRNLGLIFRIGKEFRDVYCLKSLYCALVRSVLEYGSAVWNPCYLNGSDRIERVQRRFIRWALRNLPWQNRFELPPYEDRCQLIGLDTLSCRRSVTCALCVSDVLSARIDCPAILRYLPFQARIRNLRNNSLFRIQFRRTNYSLNCGITGLLRIFNRVASVFDFHYSRATLKQLFVTTFKRFM